MYGRIYKITNTINNKVYIGQTTQTIRKRFKEHTYQVKTKSKKHYHLYNAMNKYGIDNFIVELLIECENLDELNNMEKHFIKIYDSTNTLKGYNMTEGGEGVAGIKNMKVNSGSFKKGMVSWNKGKKLSEEHINNLSKPKNKKHTDEMNKQKSKRQTGKIHSIESRSNMKLGIQKSKFTNFLCPDIKRILKNKVA